MNILFLLKSLEIGGVEVVTAVLANEFIKHGHNVFVFSFLEGKNSVSNRFDDNIKMFKREKDKELKKFDKELRKY